jgi:adenylylsulfate kinase-like enzyme
MSLAKSQAAGVIWITGLSGAGKSTIAAGVAGGLRANGESVVLLDGDELREVFATDDVNEHNYGIATRQALAYGYARLARMIGKQGFTVVIATISLFREVHEWNRANIFNYFEVYLKVPIEELRRRDPKGIYRRFDEGRLTDVVGLDLPADEPESANVVVEFASSRTVEEIVNGVIDAWSVRSK